MKSRMILPALLVAFAASAIFSPSAAADDINYAFISTENARFWEVAVNDASSWFEQRFSDTGFNFAHRLSWGWGSHKKIGPFTWWLYTTKDARLVLAIYRELAFVDIAEIKVSIWMGEQYNAESPWLVEGWSVENGVTRIEFGTGRRCIERLLVYRTTDIVTMLVEKLTRFTFINEMNVAMFIDQIAITEGLVLISSPILDGKFYDAYGIEILDPRLTCRWITNVMTMEPQESVGKALHVLLPAASDADRWSMEYHLERFWRAHSGGNLGDLSPEDLWDVLIEYTKLFPGSYAAYCECGRTETATSEATGKQ